MYSPGQCLRKHSLICSVSPSQSLPPCSGAGFVQLRLRYCVPLLQLTVHTVHSLHGVQPPCTVREGWEYGLFVDESIFRMQTSSWITFETQWRMCTVSASYEFMCMWFIPGQKSVLQSLISTKFPVQSNAAAPSVLHCLIRLCLPPPHSREHFVHGDQSDQELGLGRLSSVTLNRELSSGPPTPKLSWLLYSQVSQHTPRSSYGGLPSSHLSILSQIVWTIWIFWPLCREKNQQ